MSPQKLTMSIRASLRSRHAKLHGDFEYFPHTSNDTLPSQHLAKPFRLKHPTSLNTTSLAAPRTNQIFKAVNKELSFKCVVKAKFRNSFVCLKTIALSPKNAIALFSVFDKHSGKYAKPGFVKFISLEINYFVGELVVLF